MHEDIRVLRQRVHELKAEGRRLLERAEALESKDELTDAEATELADAQSRLDALEAEVAVAQAAVEAEERRRDREAAFAVPDGPGADGAVPARRVTSPEPDPAGTAGFADVAEFALAVQAACAPGAHAVDPRLLAGYGAAPSNYHQESGTTEGYLVPPDFRREIWELVYAADNLIAVVDAEPTNSNAVDMLADETTPWGATGVVAKWRSEGTQMTASKLALDPRMLKLHELYAFVLASDELLEDTPRLAARLTRKAAEAITWKIDDSIINGTGAGQPLGWFNAACLVTVAKESGQAADTIVAANIANMYSRLLPAGIARAFWMANSDTLPQLMTMTIGDQPIWTPPATGLRNAPGGILLGRPVRLSEHASTLGDKGDIQLVDPMGYYLPHKARGIKMDSSIHLYFDYGLQAFRWTFRLGGQPYLSAAVSPKNGSATKSHFVTLAARA